MRHTREMATASIVTIGNELVSGDTVNTNGSWLARRLEALGVDVAPDRGAPRREERVAAFVRAQAAEVDVVLVTGGLGGTPDDITREAIAAAFGVPRRSSPRSRSVACPFPRRSGVRSALGAASGGSRPLENPLGGAPGFVLGNVYVLPGLPAEMEAMFDTVAEELARRQPDRLLAPHLPDDREPDRRRYSRPGANGTRPCSSAPTRASAPRAARSRSCSSPAIQRHSRLRRPGSSRRWTTSRPDHLTLPGQVLQRGSLIPCLLVAPIWVVAVTRAPDRCRPN